MAKVLTPELKKLTPYQRGIFRNAEKRRAEIYATAMSRRGAEFNPNGLPKLTTEERGEIMQIAWDLRSRNLPPLGPYVLELLSPEQRSEAARMGWETRRRNERQKERNRRAATGKNFAKAMKTVTKKRTKKTVIQPANGDSAQQEQVAA